jgi:hypothetical protein
MRTVDTARSERRSLQQWIRGRIQLLPGRRSTNQEPDMPLGVHVVVLKGDARKDLGQMAVVSGYAGSQVEISYRGPSGLIATRRKQRSSLIKLEDGLELGIGEDGYPVIRKLPLVGTTSDDADVRIVSADEREEDLAQ